MIKTKRLLTDEEFDKFVNIRLSKGTKAADKYISTLDLFENVKIKK